jgi:hypothetical protein
MHAVVNPVGGEQLKFVLNSLGKGGNAFWTKSQRGTPFWGL